MNFKTLLRKWHSWVGLAIVIPSLVLSVTGIYLIESKQPKHALISATACDNGDWISLSSDGISGPGLKPQRLPFAITSVNAISCSQHHIDMALDYGPIATSKEAQSSGGYCQSHLSNRSVTSSEQSMGYLQLHKPVFGSFHQNNWEKN